MMAFQAVHENLSELNIRSTFWQNNLKLTEENMLISREKKGLRNTWFLQYLISK